MGKNKKGDLKYDTMGSLILGLLVLAIVFYWLFNSYFTSEDIDWETCRESLIVRNSLPEKDVLIMASSKGLLDLKCKTQPIIIDYEDTDRAEKIIGETISSIWYMTGRGEYRVFPGSSGILGEQSSPCMIPSRIHLDSEVREFYSKEDNRIDLEKAMDKTLDGYDVTVWDYLNPDRGAKAFSYFNEWDEDGFNVSFISDMSLSGFDPKNAKAFSFPKYLDPDRGDLFIIYSEPVKEAFRSDEKIISPYMILLQYDDFDKLNYIWAHPLELTSAALEAVDDTLKIISGKWIGVFDCDTCVKVCSSIETVPS